MKKQDWDEEKLISFLRENCPSLPPESEDHEDKLVSIIRRQKEETKTKGWTIPTTLAACAFLFWAGYKWQSSSVVAVAEDSKEIELFMVNTWSSMNEISAAEYIHSPNSSLSTAKPR